MTWIDFDADQGFGPDNLPFGIFSHNGGSKKAASRIGNYIIDLEAVYEIELFDGIDLPKEVLKSPVLNDLINRGKSITNGIRARLGKALNDEFSSLKSFSQCFKPISEVQMHMPVQVGDYTDFYSSIDHATNVGKMFRDPENALLPNWRHIPVGYHGRSSSIIASGTSIHRPKGQLKPKDGPPEFGPCRLLDFELEMAFVIGQDSRLGQSISTSESRDYIFGMVLFNDWSARDIQKWEYVPLGPFLGKNFASSISPWIVPLEALDFARIQGPEQNPAVLPYLQCSEDHHYNIDLQVAIATESGNSTTVCRSNYRYMYWNMAQQLAHHTVNGCNVRVGDMMASGTISGPDKSSFGSMLELSWGGKELVELNDGSTRKFLQDGDTVVMRGMAQKDGKKISFGQVETKILPTI